MKKILLLIILITGGFITINAQPAEFMVTFENESDTAGWLVFANGAAPAADDVTVVENPDTTGINETEMALRFVVNADADPWVGMVDNFSYAGDNALAITEENHIFTMMVYKTEISNVGLKLERETGGGDNVEIVLPNTLVDQWEVMNFDFSDAIGKTFEALTIFPDFPDIRTDSTVVYLDNISFGERGTTAARLSEKMDIKIYPNPASDRLFVQYPQMTGYTIRNLLGQAVEQLDFGVTDHKTIEIDKLKSGIHFITVQSKNGIHTTRFVKK